ncbi:hypothetical protein ACPEH7_08875 [Stenotrophomonas sp. NPDC101269]|uniref:hypothetical protein n=1 Tax=Stenotrophomonas TaxID=40323 RepID=UPI003C2DCC13
MRHSLRPSIYSVMLLAALPLTACRNGTNSANVFSADPMLGCYATHPRKPAEFRIEQQQGRYYVSFQRDDQWHREPTPLQESTRADIARFFKDDADQIGKALVSPRGGFGLFKFNAGATLKGKALDSDYMGLLLIGAGPIYPVACP